LDNLENLFDNPKKLWQEYLKWKQNNGKLGEDWRAWLKSLLDSSEGDKTPPEETSPKPQYNLADIEEVIRILTRRYNDDKEELYSKLRDLADRVGKQAVNISLSNIGNTQLSDIGNPEVTAKSAAAASAGGGVKSSTSSEDDTKPSSTNQSRRKKTGGKQPGVTSDTPDAKRARERRAKERAQREAAKQSGDATATA
jgi:hypothetical protein